jgi:hypothetical protein
VAIAAITAIEKRILTKMFLFFWVERVTGIKDCDLEFVVIVAKEELKHARHALYMYDGSDDLRQVTR